MMPRSPEAMRLWIEQEAHDIARVWHEQGNPPARARRYILYVIVSSMRMDGYGPQDYQAMIQEIVDREVAQVYGESDE